MKDLEQTFYNASGETIPPFGIVEITDDHSVAGRKVLSAAKPSQGLGTNPYARFRVNGPYEVPSGKTGRCYAPWVEHWVKYNTATSISNGDEWGPTSGSFELSTGGEGFIATGDGDSDRGLVMVKYNATKGTGSGTTDGGCDSCDCKDPALGSVAIDGTDCQALAYYDVTYPGTSCGFGPLGPMEYDLDDNTWIGPDFEAQCGTDPYTLTTFSTVLAATGINPGEVTLSIQESGTPKATYENETIWVPNCPRWFKLISFDCSCRRRPPERVCVYPPKGSCAAFECTLMTTTLSGLTGNWAIFNGYHAVDNTSGDSASCVGVVKHFDVPPGFGTCVVGGNTCTPIGWQVSYQFENNIGGGNWKFTVRLSVIHQCVGGGLVTSCATVAYTFTTSSGAIKDPKACPQSYTLTASSPPSGTPSTIDVTFSRP